MIEKDEYCAEIGQQINAAIGLLRAVNVDLMKNHLLCCGKRELSNIDMTKAENFVEEFVINSVDNKEPRIRHCFLRNNLVICLYFFVFVAKGLITCLGG